MRNFRLYAVLAGILLLAAAFAAVPAALAEGSGITVYEQHGDPFWFIPTVRCSDNDSIDFVTFKLDTAVTALSIDYVAGVLGYGGEKYHFESPVYVTIVAMDENFTDWTEKVVVSEEVATVDWYNFDWADWQDISGVSTHLTLDVNVALDPGTYGIAVWTRPTGAFPGELAIISEYGEPAVVHSYLARGSWTFSYRYWHPIGAITATPGEGGSSGGGGNDFVYFVEPKDNAEVGGVINVIVYASQRPTLYVDGQNYGEMKGGATHFYFAPLDTTSLDDGVHTLKAVAGSAEESITIVVANHPSDGGSEEAVKVEWIVPHDGAEVSTRFKYVIAVAWSGGNGYQPSVSITVNGYTLPAPSFVMPAPSEGELRAIGEIDLSQILDNISEKQQVTLTASASLGNASDSDVIHVFYPGEGHRTHAPSGYVVPTGSGFRVYSDTAVAVIGHFSDRDVPGKQVAAGVWYVPRPSGQVIAFALDTPSFELIGPDGNSTIVTITSSVGGWLEEPHFGTPVPGWAWVILAVVVLFFLFGRRGKRRSYRRRRW
ncbi:MAG: hypothetical protein DRP85_08665 [Candidatus Makaraimicrobium thalassicum]|nr:MAG: hypothetical protein DRP85_08665 [Candidatus Omnitrophota bacterium]